MRVRGLGFVLLMVCAHAAQAQYVDPVVQGRMLGLIRDTALASPYAERQSQALSEAGRASGMDALLRTTARESRRLGMKTGAGTTPLMVEWRGRSMPKQIVLLTAILDDGAETVDPDALAAAMGVLDAFARLQLKPRRTVRVLAAPASAATAQFSAYWAAQRGQQHTALIEITGGEVAGLRGRFPRAAVAHLDPARLALRSIGAEHLQLEASWPSAPLAPLLATGLPVFGLLQPVNGATSTPQVPALRRQVAALATLTWLLGEMPQPLPR